MCVWYDSHVQDTILCWLSYDSHMRDTQCAAMCHSVLQCVAVLGNVFHMTLMCEARFQKEQLHMRDTTYLPKKNQDY